MSLALRLLDGVEETVHTTSTPSTRHLEEGAPRDEPVSIVVLIPIDDLLPQLLDRQVRVDVLLHDLGDGHLEVLLRHVDAAFS